MFMCDFLFFLLHLVAKLVKFLDIFQYNKPDWLIDWCYYAYVVAFLLSYFIFLLFILLNHLSVIVILPALVKATAAAGERSLFSYCQLLLSV